MRRRLFLALLAGAASGLAGAATPLLAQERTPPNGVLLVASPDMPDPRFQRTVILVTQTPDGETVGVILNRPGRRKLSDLVSGPLAQQYAEPLYEGGPVFPDALVALFRSTEPPAAPAFHVLRDVYLSMHPANVYPLIAQDEKRYRLYAGFSGWKPGQLAAELARGGWTLASAREDFVFREDTGRLWEELMSRASGRRTGWK